MIDIFDYLDYREYLNDYWHDEKKSRPYFSIRFISRRVSINPGYILKVFQGKVHLGLKNIPPFANLIGLKGKERDYFELLVHFGRARNEKEIEAYFERLSSIRNIQFRTIAENEVDIFQNWYIIPLRTIISIFPFDGKNFHELGSFLHPPITAAQARQGIFVLKRLGMIKKNEKGFYQLTDKFVFTDLKWDSPIFRNYQRKLVERALESFERQDKSLTDFTNIVTPFPLDRIPELYERVTAFSQELLAMAKETPNCDCVMEMSIQLLSAAVIKKHDKKL